jgi:hypothetical protein
MIEIIFGGGGDMELSVKGWTYRALHYCNEPAEGGLCHVRRVLLAFQ